MNVIKSKTPIKAALILSRIPLIAPELSKMEASYYKYQSELEKRLMWTFPSYYYFKKGTLSEHKFSTAQKTPIYKDPNVWFPKGVPDVRHGRERSQKQVINLPKDKDATGISRPVTPNSIITEADKKNDLTSLERQLRKTLYLLVENKDGNWGFPSFLVQTNSLDETAEDGVRKLGGPHINTWTVSKKPVGVIKNIDGSAEFFIKSHILAGKFDLQQNESIKQYAWLTKEEIKDRVKEDYFNSTTFLLDN